MAETPRRTAAITSVGHYLPPDRLTNADLEKIVDTSDEWIRTRTGVRERRILRDETKATSFMATEAARECLAKAGVDAEDIGCILVATVSPDMVFPATACLVQNQLGATNAWGYDISAACSGFLFALTTGAKLVESGMHDRVLVIGADTMSRIIDYTDRTTCVIFGDGAGAVLLEPATDETGLLDSVQHVDGSNAEALNMPAGGSRHPATHETVDARMHFLKQDGRTVFKRAVVGMAEAAAEIMDRNDLAAEDIRYLVPHQANLRIIEATAKRMGIGSDQVMVNIQRYGNTTAATIPLCLSDWEPQLRRGDNLVLAAFGGGFSWGATWIKWAYDGAKGEG
ncbi:beta-ketoacyl-ACP synthase III [Rubrivirga sp. S365]|uniref:Beta-ketoacyl-[acyl-carrier-protein] synthase III n=1 Tax=Rubrivirga litoralis TaxID=3075598 RepID=A0ABU3BP63_9BACT|nr:MULTISPECIES: beta-ketoacyl-ACP synthase III [unclassified Rubrivirga]MDT0631078.1 beta-ketoacyl-ACP synthase III [Rubrivirga sp. F394]MDT7855410.1 beta-ketoacyl-ACP synthase III [Rubrivirga sp. S365]